MTQNTSTNVYNTLVNRLADFFRKPFFSDYRTIAGLWALLAVIATLMKGGLDGHLNNFLIFRGVFDHLTAFQPLYDLYPSEYHDCNHYGPFFSIIVAPFALLPKFWGLLLWQFSLGACLFFAIVNMPMKHSSKILIMWLISNEVLSSFQMAQFNLAIAALVVSAYTAIRAGPNGWAALFVVIGTFTKIYGIVGLAFILFSNRKWRFTGWLALWSAVAFILPMFISSPEYVIQEYLAWAQSLIEKNSINVDLDNAANYFQNISFLGMVHRISGREFSDMFILLPAMLLFLLPFVRTRIWASYGFQWGIVASALMCIILFSSSSESSGYVIAMLGVGIWYVSAPWKRTTTDTILLLFALILGSFGTSDLMPSGIKRGFIRPYSLKALPITIVWLKLIWELCTRNYPLPQRHLVKTNPAD